MKNKKWIGAVVLTCLLFFGFAIQIYGTSNNPYITRQEIQSPNTRANRASITQKVLADTGNTGRFDPSEATNIFIFIGNVLGNGGGNEVVIVIEFGSKNSIAAVYEPNGDQYNYIGNLGDFFYIRNVDFLPLAEGKDVIILREYANQDIGAFERSSFLRGYYWDGNQFQEVLRVPEGIEATWNDLWDNNTQDGKTRWNRIEQQTDITYSNGQNPALSLTSYQAHRVTPETESKNRPRLEDFDTVANRVVSESYYWSDDWKRFIISEMTQNSTGETVAVIEDLGASPYALLSDYAPYINQVRILKRNGTSEIVEKDTLSPIEGEQTANVFIRKNTNY